MGVTWGQQYNIEEKPIVILYTYVNRHAGTPEKQRKQKHCSTSSNMVVVIISCYIGCEDEVTTWYYSTQLSGRPGSSEVPRNPLTRWDVSSIPANGIFLPKKLKTKIKMPNGWRTIKSFLHKIRLHGRRRKGMAEYFSREKLRHAPQKEGG